MADMPKPPGGTLTCPSGSRGIVRKNKATGEIFAECKPFTVGASNQQFGNAMLGVIYNTPRISMQEFTAQEISILESGFFEDEHYEYVFDPIDVRGEPMQSTDS